MNLVEIGRTGRPHGIQGELKLFVEEAYQPDLLAAKAILIGRPPIPYFVERMTGGGSLRVKLETFDRREQVVLLSNKPVYLPEEQVSVTVEEEGTPWDEILGFSVESEHYPLLPPIEEILDLPDHYLAKLTYGDKEVLLPLHDDLLLGVDRERKVVQLRIAEGLIDLFK